MSDQKNEKEQRRRPCSSCGGYTFKSVAGVWRHWPYPPNFDTPIECRDVVIPPDKED